MSWNSSLERKGGCARQKAQCRQRYGVMEVPNGLMGANYLELHCPKEQPPATSGYKCFKCGWS